MRTLTLAVLGLTFAAHNPLRAQKPWLTPPHPESTDPVVLAYRDTLPTLIERYSTDRKIRYRVTRYVLYAFEGKAVGDVSSTAVVEVVTDGRQLKLVTLEGKTERHPAAAHFWRPDMRYGVAKAGDGYEIVERHLAESSYSSHEFDKSLFFAHVPMRAGDHSITPLWFDRRGEGEVIETAVETRPATRNGKACVEVRSQWDNRHGFVPLASTFLDSANDFATLGTETDWKKNPPQGDYKAISEVEYGPSPEGVPLPKWCRSFVRDRAGLDLKVCDIEFLAYDRYVPSPREFLLEVDYGLATPPVGLSAGDAGVALTPDQITRAWSWGVLTAAVALAAVGTVAFYVRSRRPATGTPW